MAEIPEAPQATEAPKAAGPAEGETHIYDISGPQPVLGTVPHDAVQEAVASGKYALPQGSIKVFNPDGELGEIDAAHAPAAFQQGFTYATPHAIKMEKYGTGTQAAIAGLEGAAKGIAGPLATGAERLAGVPAEDIEGREEANPGTHFGSELAGFAGSAFIPGGQARVLEKLGAGAVGKLGLEAAEGAGALAKIGSAAAKGFVENAAYQVGNELSSTVLRDPNQDLGHAAIDVGLAGLLGGVVGGGIGSVSPLWEATSGTGMGQFLKKVVSKAGGIEGGAGHEIDSMITRAGMSAEDVAPEIKASMSNDPQLKALQSTLEHTDTNTTGRGFQETGQNFRGQVGEAQANAFGKDLSSIPEKSEIDRYSTGKHLADTLAGEFDEKIGPLVKEYEGHAERFKNVPLGRSVEDRAADMEKLRQDGLKNIAKAQKDLSQALKANSPEAAIEANAKLQAAQATLNKVQTIAEQPGVTDVLAQRIMDRVQHESWHLSAHSDIMKEVNRVLTDLPGLKTVRDLGKYISIVGDNTASTLPFGVQTPVSRAGGIIKGILRDGESELIGKAIGSEAGADALARYTSTRQAYAAAAALKDSIDDRIGAGGSVAGYGKMLRAMGKQEGEKFLNRLSGGKDADLLATLQKEFPKTAEVLKDHHVTSMLAAAKDGEGLSSAKLMSAMNKMSPQMRDFALPQEGVAKAKAAHALLEAFGDKTHNWSNTARTLDKVLGGVPGGAVSLAALLVGHNPLIAAMSGAGVKWLGKDIPDAMRLATLKFMGSNQKISAPGFKAMVDTIQSTMKGENLAGKAVKSLFKGATAAGSGAAVTERHMPDEKSRAKLDKIVQKAKQDPQSMLNVGGHAGYYLPDHGAALGGMAGNALKYLASLKPTTTPASPLDGKVKPSAPQTAAYNNALDIAQQPLIVMDKIQKGNLTAQDIGHLKAIYPNLYSGLVSKVNTAMLDHVSKGGTVPYRTRIGLSAFMGQALDSSMTPQSILAAQPTPAQQPQEDQKGESMKHSTKDLGKLVEGARTPLQQREAQSAKA